MSDLKRCGTLPDGQSGAGLTRAQGRAIWQHWRGLMAVLLPRGESCRISRADKDVEISIVYASQQEDGAVVIGPAGTACDVGMFPDYVPDARPAPWEGATAIPDRRTDEQRQQEGRCLVEDQEVLDRLLCGCPSCAAEADAAYAARDELVGEMADRRRAENARS